MASRWRRPYIADGESQTLLLVERSSIRRSVVAPATTPSTLRGIRRRLAKPPRSGVCRQTLPDRPPADADALERSMNAPQIRPCPSLPRYEGTALRRRPSRQAATRVAQGACREEVCRRAPVLRDAAGANSAQLQAVIATRGEMREPVSAMRWGPAARRRQKRRRHDGPSELGAPVRGRRRRNRAIAVAATGRSRRWRRSRLCSDVACRGFEGR